ncbi:MAG: hypothetical protein ACUVUE_01365 [Candidatus Bathycorpusculaceae bacterium]
MSPENLLKNYWLARIVIVLWLVSAISVMLLFNKIDGIVHGDLYDFGLQFSFDWASPYWAFSRLIFVSLGLPMALSLLVLGLDLLRKSTDKHVVKQEGKSVDARSEGLREDGMDISCPSCRKVFSRPLVIIDFGGGRPKLVNVCPYCNHVLGCADEGESSSDMQMMDMEKKLVH